MKLLPVVVSFNGKNWIVNASSIPNLLLKLRKIMSSNADSYTSIFSNLLSLKETKLSLSLDSDQWGLVNFIEHEFGKQPVRLHVQFMKNGSLFQYINDSRDQKIVKAYNYSQKEFKECLKIEIKQQILLEKHNQSNKNQQDKIQPSLLQGCLSHSFIDNDRSKNWRADNLLSTQQVQKNTGYYITKNSAHPLQHLGNTTSFKHLRKGTVSQLMTPNSKINKLSSGVDQDFQTDYFDGSGFKKNNHRNEPVNFKKQNRTNHPSNRARKMQEQFVNTPFVYPNEVQEHNQQNTAKKKVAQDIKKNTQNNTTKVAEQLKTSQVHLNYMKEGGSKQVSQRAKSKKDRIKILSVSSKKFQQMQKSTKKLSFILQNNIQNQYFGSEDLNKGNNYQQMISSKEDDSIWDKRMRILSKVFGFDEYEPPQFDNSHNSILKAPEQKKQGVLLMKNYSKTSNLLDKRQLRNPTVKKKWEQVMRVSAKSARSQILDLLKDNIPIYDRVWIWMLNNNQKINPKLYSLRRAQFKDIVKGMINGVQNYRFQSLTNLPSLVKHEAVSNVIGSLLLHRQDISYSVAVYNIAATFYYYSQSNEMTTFLFLVHTCTSELFVSFLSKDYKSINEHIVFISGRLRLCCPSIVFINGHKNVQVQCFIEAWLQSFFFPICENGSTLKQIILSYLILEQFSRVAVSRVCEATIVSLSRILNQGNREKCIQVLNHPKIYMDEVLFKNYLLQ